MAGFIVFAVVFGLLLLAMARFAVWVRTKGLGSGLMGPIDEAWHPSAHRFRQETAVHEERTLPPRPTDDTPP